MASVPKPSAQDVAWFGYCVAALAFAASVYQFLGGLLPRGIPGIVLSIVIAAASAAVVLLAIMAATRFLATGPKPPWFVALVGAVLLLVGTAGGFGLSLVWDLQPKLEFAVNGACDRIGQTLHASSANFTPGGQYVSRVWYPDGTEYDLDSTRGTANEDGTIGFRWPCESDDPDGVYQAEITDLETGRRTERVRFVVRAGGARPAPTPAVTPTPPVSPTPTATKSPLPTVEPTAGPSATREGTDTIGEPTPSASPLEFSVIGECRTVGEKLLAESSGFTPGGQYRSEAWYPGGARYPLDFTVGTANSDGTVNWGWTCEADDPAGTYTTTVTDLKTGRNTGRVSFTVH